MQFLLSVIDDTARVTPDADHVMGAIDAFNDKLRANGHWVFADGLHAPETATTVDNRGAEPIVTDGPFLENKEFLAGFWIIEVDDFDAALALATEGSKACNRKVEVRGLH